MSNDICYAIIDQKYGIYLTYNNLSDAEYHLKELLNKNKHEWMVYNHWHSLYQIKLTQMFQELAPETFHQTNIPLKLKGLIDEFHKLFCSEYGISPPKPFDINPVIEQVI